MQIDQIDDAETGWGGVGDGTKERSGGGGEGADVIHAPKIHRRKNGNWIRVRDCV